MLSAQVYDVIDGSRSGLEQGAPDSVDAVRQAAPMIRFSDQMAMQSATLKQFLLRNLYRHARVMETTVQAKRVVADLFVVYMQTPGEMQAGFSARAARAANTARTARVVADYIAGMTDRFASREHIRLTGLQLLVAVP